MVRISVELVPRDKNSLINELKLIKTYFSSINTINIVDLTKYDLRSYQACKFAKDFFENIIPHIRAMDINKYEPIPFKDCLKQNGICEILVVSGDMPKSIPGKLENPHSLANSIDIIKKFKKEMPDIKVYAAIDQYRSSFQEEYEYIQRKINVGADGFFTQPFFDLRLMEFFLKKLDKIEIFWGASPVTTEKSKQYWETKNNARFPADFKATLEWNRKFAREALDLTRKNNSHIYFMPIKTDIREYLAGII